MVFTYIYGKKIFDWFSWIKFLFLREGKVQGLNNFIRDITVKEEMKNFFTNLLKR